MAGNQEKVMGERRKSEGREDKNHNARRAGRRREKLSYLCRNRGKGAFADWSCHGNGWHLVYVWVCVCVCLCAWSYLCVQSFVYVHLEMFVSVFVCGGGGLNGGSCWGIISVVRGKWGRGPERHNKALLARSVDGKHTVNTQPVSVCVCEREMLIFYTDALATLSLTLTQLSVSNWLNMKRGDRKRQRKTAARK